MPDPISLPLYFDGVPLAEMEARLRRQYLTASGWLDSAEAKLSVRDGKPLPWFTYGAIAFLEQQITPDLALFEYGGGQSTLFWADRVRRVVSVDHDPAFARHVRQSLPGNAEFFLIEEGAALSDTQARYAADRPDLADPARDTATYRSGQLNQAFQAYALKLLDYPADSFDVVIVDGMARMLSTWAAIRHFDRGGFIVFDNSDRDFYRPAFALLDRAGYRRLDFWGLGPINPYAWCTSVFYRPTRFTGTRWFGATSAPAPAAAPDVAPAADALGILVLGYNRPHHLQSVLESLRLQDRIGDVHVWIDGTRGRGEYLGAATRSIEIANRYAVRDVQAQYSHLGIEKMMLDALDTMSRLYDRVLVLEDDCFPLEGGVDLIEAALAEVADRPDIYSVYGHPFGTEPEDSRDFPRFQGWGWAAHSARIRAYLPRLRELFLMSEQTYKAHVADRLTPEVLARLDRTPGRNVANSIRAGFSWDSATAFLTACDAVGHRRTAARAVTNTGISAGIGHFREDKPMLRAAPFNMITLDEAWQHYDRTTLPCDRSQDSYGLEGLDRIIRDVLPRRPGFFIEIGANDGVTQSNSILLEAAGWRGMLIEAVPGLYARCVRARPDTIVEFAACVARGHAASHTTVTDVGLMSMTAESLLSGDTREDWTARGEGFAKRPRQEIEVPVATLSGLLDKHRIARVDVLLLDVEGAETAVLGGLDFSRHAPRFIVAEDPYDDSLRGLLETHGYRLSRVLLKRKYTRDCLYVPAAEKLPASGG